MTTWFIRERPSGEIVNAVETDSLSRATEVLRRMSGDLYLDSNPPRDVLERYEFWDRRP